MMQWDIFLYPFEDAGPHPAVVLSPNERCQNPAILHINALLCTSVKINREPKPIETVLDEADGLDWKTAVRCNVIYLLPKADFLERRGSVNLARRRAIGRKLIECFRLPF